MSRAFRKATRAGDPDGFQLGKILVADDDPDLLMAIEAALRAEGHQVVTARTGWEAVRLAREQLPWLLILDAAMPGVSGYEVCRRLRSDWRFADRGIILLTSETQPEQRSFGLAAGADDFVLKPFDLVELADRVRLTRRRLLEMRSSSPLTGLPGNAYIQRELERRVGAGDLVALLYVDLDRFKAYNDHYGFLRGDEAIRALADVLRTAVDGRSDAFLGHVGGDDFVVLTRPDAAEGIAADVISGFEAKVANLYEPEDAARGWIEVKDRRGSKHRQGLLTLSVGVATNVGRAIEDHRRLVDLAAEMKEFAKSRPGNAVAVDRRTQRDLGPLGRSAGWYAGTAPPASDRGVHADRAHRSGLVRLVPRKSGRTRAGGAPRRGRRRAILAYAAIALLTLGLVAGPATVVLAENARPGETLWPVKLWIERVRLVLERDAEKDVALRLEFASRRVGDLQYVAAQQSPLSLVAEVTENLSEHIEAAMPTFRELAEEDSDESALGSQMELVLRQSIQVLQGLVATACQGGGDRPAPAEAACTGLQRALANSTAAMERIRELPEARGGQRGGGVEEPPGKGDGNGSPGKGSGRDQPGHGQGNRGKDNKQPPGKGQDEQPQGALEDKQRPGQGKDKQPPGQGKDKQPPGQGKAKDKEPPEQGNDEEEEEEPPGQDDDAQPPDGGKATDQSGKGKGAGL